ncbi:biotin--[acetyl-CoA-carboxylase] ligase [Propionibacterium sp. oral taxon 192]|uniref:biotin--[acetyl-CoA-carboxylase] ligase n=1 Tax=Propionibacterium sp. oral taxon 192 TaxID=671222 RepID=UPI0018DBA7FA|nr:biotin--[acetyl-CoA-carboxylase] ligase [Propionibacterium sp. oral taxon 192]
MPSCPPLDIDRITPMLQGRWQVTTVVSTGSTNADLLVRARRGAEAGQVLVAENQTAGRGRFERCWLSPPGSSLSTSVLLRPSRPMTDWGWLSLLVGVAVRDGVAAAGAGDRVRLKWPNDVLVGGRKICGILCEGAGAAVVCGFGINVSQGLDELVFPNATSLLLEGLPTDKTLVLAAILRRFAELVDAWDDGQDVSPDYIAACSTIGRQVRVHLDAEHPDEGTVVGTAVGIGDDGELLVEIDGEIRPFSAGDVVHLR